MTVMSSGESSGKKVFAFLERETKTPAASGEMSPSRCVQTPIESAEQIPLTPSSPILFIQKTQTKIKSKHKTKNKKQTHEEEILSFLHSKKKETKKEEKIELKKEEKNFLFLSTRKTAHAIIFLFC